MSILFTLAFGVLFDNFYFIFDERNNTRVVRGEYISYFWQFYLNIIPRENKLLWRCRKWYAMCTSCWFV